MCTGCTHTAVTGAVWPSRERMRLRDTGDMTSTLLSHDTSTALPSRDSAMLAWAAAVGAALPANALSGWACLPPPLSLSRPSPVPLEPLLRSLLPCPPSFLPPFFGVLPSAGGSAALSLASLRSALLPRPSLQQG